MGYEPVTLLRRFHRPTGLTPDSVLSLWLDVTAAGEVTAELNRKALECCSREVHADAERLVFPINAGLLDFNELQVTVRSPDNAATGAVLSAAAIVIDD